MLNFQNKDCNTSLQEGIDEYRSYLRKNNRYILGEQVSDSEKWGILCHDATHVIFWIRYNLRRGSNVGLLGIFWWKLFSNIKRLFFWKNKFQRDY